MHRAARAVLAAGVLAALLAGCTGGAPAPDDPRAAAAALAELDAHNDADVGYARDMLPHHGQGLELSGLVPARGSSPAVRDLAALIDRQQGAEIGQLRGTLRSWGVPEPDPHAPMPGMSAAAGPAMPGMASPATLGRLRALRGNDFDRLWLQTMITHHEGAVRMARAELAGGTAFGTRNAARNVISVQQAQIDTMRTLLDRG